MVLQENLALFGDVGSGDDLDEGRFPSAVVAEECDRLAGVEINGDVVKRKERSELFVEVAHGEERHPNTCDCHIGQFARSTATRD